MLVAMCPANTCPLPQKKTRMDFGGLQALLATLTITGPIL